MIYYHVAQPLLSSGSIIEPGNFGRILLKYTIDNDISILYREEIFERLRIGMCPEKPSRLKSCYLLDTLQNAKVYRSINAVNQNIYEVEIVDKTKMVHKGMWCVPFSIRSMSYSDYCAQYAMMYWESNIKPVTIESFGAGYPVELIVESPIRVLKRLDV